MDVDVKDLAIFWSAIRTIPNNRPQALAIDTGAAKNGVEEPLFGRR